MNEDSLRSLMPPIDPFGFAELMQDIGNALWRLQILEQTVLQYLVMLHGMEEALATDAAETMLERNRKRTLGQLVMALGGSTQVPDDLSARLEALVEPRNWLVHRSQGECRRMVASASGRATISARIGEITDAADVVLRLIVEHVEREAARRGVTPEMAQSRAEAEMRSRYGT